MWMTGTSLIFLFLSIVFTKNQIRPIIKLARAADKFGKGQQHIDLKSEGAKEIRKAASAFIKMKERIEKQMSSRTEMLAGISHDLRTPLTRMKLQLAMSKDSSIEAMSGDINDMENMINAYINFAKGDNEEEAKKILLSKFINSALTPYKEKNLVVTEIPSLKISTKPHALKRCFQNILDNAFKYGDRVIISFSIKQNLLIIDFQDNGPGIPEGKREDVFKPFFRLDESRNKDTGGAGLGLAITKDIIISLGGEIFLSDSKNLEGLKVTFTIPI
jgi:two-component system osmolarity sensor histidine kinase EnvZ